MEACSCGSRPDQFVIFPLNSIESMSSRYHPLTPFLLDRITLIDSVFAPFNTLLVYLKMFANEVAHTIVHTSTMMDTPVSQLRQERLYGRYVRQDEQHKQ